MTKHEAAAVHVLNTVWFSYIDFTFNICCFMFKLMYLSCWDILKHWFIDPLIYLFIYLFIHSFIHSFIYPLIHLSIHLFIQLSIHWSIHPFIHLSIHLSIHPFINWSIFICKNARIKLTICGLPIADDITEIMHKFNKERTTLPLMFISTPDDRFSSYWTKKYPTAPVLRQFVILAQKAVDVLHTQISDCSLQHDFKVFVMVGRKEGRKCFI